MHVPLLDLQPQMAQLRPQVMEALAGFIDSTRYILGPEVERFEQAVAAYSGSRFAVGVSSGTDALIASLMALGIGPGDKVITTPFSFFATMGSVLRVGAEPVFVDIEPRSFNLDPAQVQDALARDRSGAVKAVIPVHLYGQCADMQPLLEITAEVGVALIEDAAQAIGSEYPFETDGRVVWKRAGSMGQFGCFSFFPSKNLGGIGDGGMVTVSDDVLAEALVILRNHGAQPKYYHSLVGGNFRLDPVQAVVLSLKLPLLNSWHRGRQANSARYRRLFADAGLVDDPVVLPEEVWAARPDAVSHNHHIYNQFVIRVPQRDALRAFLQERGVGTEVYYPLCLHQQECLTKRGREVPSLPVAEQAARETLALPIYPELSQEQQEYVVSTIRQFYAAG